MPLLLLSFCRRRWMCTKTRSSPPSLKKLGEGGYAYVYLVRELPTPTTPLVDTSQPLALKRLHAATRERLECARREIEAMRAVAPHGGCLELLDYAIAPAAGAAPGGSAAGGGARELDILGRPAVDGPGGAVTGGGGGGAGWVVCMLTPAFEDGTLADEVAALHKTGARLSPSDVLDVFEQVCWFCFVGLLQLQLQSRAKQQHCTPLCLSQQQTHQNQNQNQ
jgi:serine/threonine protein kinase